MTTATAEATGTITALTSTVQEHRPDVTRTRRRRAATASLERKASTSKAEPALERRGRCAAESFLLRRGYDVIERDWACCAGIADIIAIDGETLVFVEVNVRGSMSEGFPSEAATREKRKQGEQIALAYLAESDLYDMAVRFDTVSIVAIASDRALIRHHISAFSVA